MSSDRFLAEQGLEFRPGGKSPFSILISETPCQRFDALQQAAQKSVSEASRPPSIQESTGTLQRSGLRHHYWRVC